MQNKKVLIVKHLISIVFSALVISFATFGQTSPQVQTLLPNQPIEREMKGDEAHSYSIAVTAGQFLQVVVDQRGIDVVVTLFGADGKKLAEVDSPNGTQGSESISILTETSGNYRLEVRSLEKTAQAGRYEVKIEELRTATEKDKNKLAAEKAFAEGEVLRLQGTAISKRAAIPKIEQAENLFMEMGDEKNAASCLIRLGLIYSSLGEHRQALKFFTNSLSLSIKVGDVLEQARSLNNIGSVYSLLGEKQKALEFFNQSLPLFIKVGNVEGQATTLHNVGTVYNDLGEKQKALEFYYQALPLRIKVDDIGGQATTLNNIGYIVSSLGDKRKSLEFFNQALVLRIKINDVSGQAVTLNHIGLVYDNLGEKQKALGFYNQALPLSISVGDVNQQATTLNNIGGIYNLLSEKQKALEFFNQALPLSINVGDVSLQATILNNIGFVYDDLSDKQKTLEFFNKALLLRIKIGDLSGQAVTLNNIGNVYNLLGKKQKALEFYNQALPLSTKVGDVNVQATILNNIGFVYFDLGEKQKALEFFNQALPKTLGIIDTVGQGRTLNNLMFVWESLKNKRLAIFYGKQAVNKYQELRSNINDMDKSVQQTYLKAVVNTYRYLAEIFIAEGRFTEAQQTLNLFKDQQFFDFNRNPNEPIKQLTQTPRETEFSLRYQKSSEQIGKVGSEFDDLKRKIGTRHPTTQETAQLQKLESDLKTATDNFLAVLKQAETEFSKPADEKDKVGEIPDTREMQTALRTLNEQTGQKTVAVYTLVGEDNFRALIVSPDGIKAVSSPIKGIDLNAKALKLWGLLQSPYYDTTVLSKQIYDRVFKPIEAALPKDTTTIMWSLDGNLRYIPMAALWDGKRFLAERFNHVIFTRADAERMTRAVNPNWTGTGFGTSERQTVELLGSKISFSALPGVKAELSEIFKTNNSPRGILAGEVIPDKEFTKANFIESIKRKRPVVHIASHFSFRPGDEARSFLLLGDGTPFTLSEMKAETNLFQSVDLLTLSACNTAATQQDANGREIDGFAELAQRLGAGAVMATLWNVSDASTPWLMRDFYATRQANKGITKTETLKKAQLGLLNGSAKIKPLEEVKKGSEENKVQIVILPKDGKRDETRTGSEIIYLNENEAPPFKKDEKKPFAHPYYWSPFVLYGNWK